MSDVAFAAPEAVPCNLLRLPFELQLAIYEMVLVEPEPLLLNCPCHSSFRGRNADRTQCEADWRAGRRAPPPQPPITRVCRTSRALALPTFYGENVFRVCYCGPRTTLDAPLKWLKAIGPHNREALRNLYFYDRNSRFDSQQPGHLDSVKALDIFGEMGGRMDTVSSHSCSAHHVFFGARPKQTGRAYLAVQREPRRLRLAGEA